MKALGCTVIVVLLTAAFCNAAEAKTGNRCYQGILSAGSQALSFEVGSSFTLRSFLGSLFSYQRFVRDRTALRLGISVGHDVEDTRYSAEFTGSDTAGDADATNWHHSYTVVGQVLRYGGRGDLVLYYGGGPQFTYDDRRYEATDYYLSGDGLEERHSRHERRVWSLGLSGSVGVQWCVSRHIAPHAEYPLSALYENSQDTREERRGPDEHCIENADADGFALQSDGVIFGLSAYF